MGSLLRTTLEQVGAVKEAVEQQTRARGGLLDQALVQRRRKEAMAKLGEAVYRMAQAGTIGELALEPKIALRLEEIDALDGDTHESWQDEDDFARMHAPEAVSSANFRAQRSESSEPSEYRVWRPTLPSAADTVEEAAPVPMAAEEPHRSSPTKTSSARLPRKVAQRSGGSIRFVEERARPEDPDSDEDLASYMHEDDVPDRD